MARESEIKLKFVIDGKQAELTLDNLGNRAAGAGDKMRDATDSSDRFVNSMTDLRNVAQGLREGFDLLTGIFAKPFEEYKSQELAVSRINGLLRATGNSAKIATDDLVEMANVLSRVTNFTDDDILAAQGALLSFDKLGGMDLERIVRLSTDLAAALGQDVAGSAEALGKAMQDPAGGLMTLNRSLRLFTDEEKKAVEAMADAGDVAGAQEAILARLESRISGVAEEMRNTNVGAVIQAQKEWDNLNETLGGVIAQGLEPTASGFAKIAQWLNEVNPTLAGSVGAVGALTAAYVVLNATGVLPMFFNSQKMTAALDTARVRLHLAGAEASVASKSLEMAKISAKGFAAALGPLGWITLGITAVTTAVGLMSKATDQAADAAKEETNAVMRQKVEFNSLVDAVKKNEAGSEARVRAINDLNAKYPDYIKNINLERAGIAEIAKWQAAANKEFDQKIKLMVIERRVDPYLSQLAKVEESISLTRKRLQEKGFIDEAGNLTPLSGTAMGLDKTEVNLYGNFLNQVKDINTNIDRIKQEAPTSLSGTPKPTGPGGTFTDQGANSIKDYERSLRMLKDAGAGWNEQLEFINQSLTEVEGKLGGKLTAKEAERMQQLKVTLINERSALMKEAEEFDKYITNLKIQSIDELRSRDLAELEWKYNEEQKMVLAKATNEAQGQAALVALKEKFLREYGEIEQKYQIGLIGEQEQRVHDAEERMRLAKTDFELAKAKDALIIEQNKLEEMKRMNQRSAEEIYAEWARKNPFGNAALAGLEGGVQMFWDRFAMDHRQAKDDWDAIWLAMKNRALAEIGELAVSGIMDWVKGLASGNGEDKKEGLSFWDFIPFLASGGIVNKPTLAMVGEKGPEAVVPLDHYRNLMMPQPRVPMHIILKQQFTGKMEVDMRKLSVRLDNNKRMYERLGG